jgi:hypothetical protein
LKVAAYRIRIPAFKRKNLLKISATYTEDTVHEMLKSAGERCERVVGKAAAVQENKIGILRVAN